MKAINLTLALILAAVAFGCASLKRDDSVLTAKIDAVQQKFAPDRHLAIFKVEAKRHRNSVTLRGEIDNPVAKEELLQSVGEVVPKVIDEITLLPDDSLQGKTAGISVVSAATVREEPSPGAELGTQVLLGHSVKIFKSKGFWFYVQSNDGYLGWLERDQFFSCTPEKLAEWTNAAKVMVTAEADHVWQDGTKALPVCDVVPGCLLKKVGDEGNWTKVQLADGRSGVINTSSVMDFGQWKRTRQANADNIERTAKSLLGVPYLWGGTSTKMLDCSGFTKTVYYLNGVDLLRNASHQFRQGTPVEPGENFENLHKGDLIFFGHKAANGKAKVTHVGIYLENGLFIHSSGLVHISSLRGDSELRDEARIKTFIGARRILPN